MQLHKNYAAFEHLIVFFTRLLAIKHKQLCLLINDEYSLVSIIIHIQIKVLRKCWKNKNNLNKKSAGQVGCTFNELFYDSSGKWCDNRYTCQ